MKMFVFDALINQDFEQIFEYISSQNDINILDKRQCNMLHYAVRMNHVFLAKKLVEANINVNQKDTYGETPLSLAAHMGNFEIVELLINHDARINTQDFKGLTPLHKACNRGKMEIIYLLLSKGAKLSARTENGILPIHMSVRSNKPEIIRLLLDYGASVYEADNRKNNVLHHALMYSNKETIWYVIENTSNINTRNLFKKNPLHLACEKNDREVVQLLLEKGILIDVKDSDGNTALDIAKQFNNYAVYDLLYETVSNINYVEYSQKYLLHRSIMKEEYTKAFKYIEISDVNQKDTFGNSPIFYALMNESIPMVKALLEKGAKILDVDSAHYSGLFYATNTFNAKMVQLMIKANADVNEEINGRTPLFRALLSNNADLFKLFIDAGANIEWDDPKGKPLRMYAFEYANEEILQYFL